MVVTWITAIFLIVFSKIATRNMKLVPEGVQNLCEWLVESLHTF
jgi:F0F1-type ATP synthase membrane subunit a